MSDNNRNNNTNNNDNNDRKSSSSRRAKARWGILRDALLNNSKRRTDNPQQQASPHESYSINRFPGFQLLDRVVLRDGTSSIRQRLIDNPIHVSLSSAGSAETVCDEIRNRMYVVVEAIHCLPTLALNDEDCQQEMITIEFTDGDDQDESGTVLREDVITALKERGLLPQSSSSNNTLRLPLNCNNLRSSSQQYHTIQYTLPTTSLPIITREPIRPKPSLDDLTSQRRFGVDNTGQIRVWDCASTLAHALPTISRVADDAAARGKRRRVIELGAGSAGLAGLSCALSGDDVILTDGHPSSVTSNAIAAILTSAAAAVAAAAEESLELRVRARRLLWKCDEVGAGDCASLGNSSFDLVLVSDCLHFRECHGGLLATMGRLLRVGGCGVLCQPERGGTMRLFLELVKVLNLEGPFWNVQVEDTVGEELRKRHEEYLGREDYNPDVHYPKIVILRKEREFVEGEDTCRILECLKKRKSPELAC